MPGFVADSDKPFVKLVSTEDAQSLEYRRIGLKTPGWSYHKQITREGGGFVLDRAPNTSERMTYQHWR